MERESPRKGVDWMQEAERLLGAVVLVVHALVDGECLAHLADDGGFRLESEEHVLAVGEVLGGVGELSAAHVGGFGNLGAGLLKGLGDGGGEFIKGLGTLHVKNDQCFGGIACVNR